MLLQNLVRSDLPFVIYKNPHSGQIHIWQQNKSDLITTSNLKKDGFYFAPFDLDKHDIVLFPLKDSKRQSAFIRDLKIEKNDNISLSVVPPSRQEEDNYQKKVEKAIKIIKEGTLEKIVLSRKQKIDYKDFTPFNAFLKLLKKYEQSYVYLWSHPKVGQWMGATPEVLLSAKNTQVQTMALAGTLPVLSGQPVSWQIKEIKEQQYVTDYILKITQKYTSDFKVSPPQTVYQGNLAHIQSVITANIAQDKIADLVLDMHPTPAVCGLPSKKALKYIEEIEAYDRQYYTGFLGEKVKHKMGFYVNLRSMSLNKDYLEFYVGGGIVKDSQPEKEWTETIYKSKIILSVFS